MWKLLVEQKIKQERSIMIFLFIAALLAAEPTAEELAFKLVSDTKVGTASTTHKNGPLGSMMPYALDDLGRPIVFLSDLAVHTKNIKKNSQASIFVTEPTKEVEFDNPRLTLIGKMVLVPKKELEEARKLYFKRFPEAKIFEQFHDFSMYRLEITDIYYVGGFGPKPIQWLDIKKYQKAAK